MLSAALMSVHQRALRGLGSSQAIVSLHASYKPVYPRRPSVRIFRRPLERQFSTEAIPSFLVPPAVFLGLLVSLWTYKCFMTVVFQNKIIYMPYMPPFARSEVIDDYLEACKPVNWSTRQIRSIDGVKLSLCVGKLAASATTSRYVICYFQGNGASLPPRLPMLSQVLKAIAAQSGCSDVELVALSYRGYWTSSGRASERGIRKDSQALLAWVRQTYGESAKIVLWGQSIGAGVACAAAADALETTKPAALILETPFTSIKSMLKALYPQRWLPYQYLWPFLWNHWDSLQALHLMADAGAKPPVLLLVAKRDEVVPAEEARKIGSALKHHAFDSTRVDILGSLHTEATTRREGQMAIARFIQQLESKCSC